MAAKLRLDSRTISNLSLNCCYDQGLDWI